MSAALQPASVTFERSPESFAFEAFWRSLRVDGLLPARTHFHPGKAVRFLRNLVLTEVPHGENVLRMRVAGEAIQELAGSNNLTGHDQLDFLAPQYRAGALASTHLMTETPCGLWQISPAHFVQGFAKHLEITAFPLAAGVDGVPFLLTYVRPLQGLMEASLVAKFEMALDTAVQFHYLDIGAGAPA